MLRRADVPGAILLGGALGCVVLTFAAADPAREVVGPLGWVLLPVGLVLAQHRLVGGDRHHPELVGVHELGGLGLGLAGVGQAAGFGVAGDDEDVGPACDAHPCGGLADPARGTGLTGLRQRVTAVDGTLEVTSPTGGPTTLTATLPLRPGRSL